MVTSRGTPCPLALELVTLKNTKTINSRDAPFPAATFFRENYFGKADSSKIFDFLIRQLHENGVAIWVQGISLWIKSTVLVYESLVALKDTRLEPFLGSVDYQALFLDERICLIACCGGVGFRHDWAMW
jgi:hypothetical protein